MSNNTLELEVTNHMTGEVFTVEVDPYKLDSLVGALLQVQQQRKALDKLEADLKGILEQDHLAQNDWRPLASSLGYDVRWIESATKSYDPSVVISRLDQDMLITSGALTVSSTKLEKMMADLVRKGELPTEDSQAIMAAVDVKPRKPYVKLEKVGSKK